MAKREIKKMDMQAMMDIYKKVGTPGEPHKLLANLEGSWSTKTIGYLEGKPVHGESLGTSEKMLILGGHYLREEYNGEMMGAPYSGISILGYNNQTKKFESTWIDSMSTAIYFFTGKASADGKTITQECSYDDAVRGKAVWRTVTRIRDDNTLEFEMFITPKGGKEEKMMEMTSIRKEAVLSKAA
jgi:Protein of unknown function (DUF1579)